MVKFDILNATNKAYKVAWVERHYLLRLAAIPFVLRLLCYMIAAQYAPAPADYLRFTLIMLPALLAEGWMLSHFVRLLILGQRWPFRPTGNMKEDLAVLTVRARGVLSGLIVFVLISMAFGVLMAIIGNFIIPYMPEDGLTQDDVIPNHVAFLSFVILGFMIWGFRLLWLYIPYAVGADWKVYLLPLRGLSTSFFMMAIWCLCSVPAILLGSTLVGLVSGMLGDQVAGFVFMIVTVTIHIFTSITVTAGMTYALFEFFKNKKD